MTIDGCTDGDVFLALLHDVLLPHLRPGPIIILDHLKAHKVASVTAAGAAAEVSMRYLPPYAPALSPMEACWSKVKASLWAKAAHTREALEQAIAEAFETMTANEARGWFTHARYCIVSN